jgi:hypothetical protein
MSANSYHLIRMAIETAREAGAFYYVVLSA